MQRLEPKALKKLGTKHRWKRVAFMALCCEPMIPLYARYRMGGLRGCTDVLRESLDIAWRYAATGHLPERIDDSINRCVRQAPDWHHRDEPYALVAGDVCFAVAYTLRSLIAPTIFDAMEVSDVAIGLAWLIAPRYEFPVEGPGSAGNTDMVQLEVDRQMLCIDQLAPAIGGERDLIVAQIRREAQKEKWRP